MTFINRNRRKPLRPEAAMIRLEELCARSEQCVSELRRKLAGWQIEPDDADAIIRSLKTRRYVDDARYAAAFVRDKYRFARWGRRKIHMALRQKRIAEDLIDEALGNIDEQEYAEILGHILKAKARTLDMDVYEDRMKLFRFALARGFEPDLIKKLMPGR